MKKTLTSLFRHPLDYLLLLVPLTVIAWLMSWGDLWVFSLAALGIIPLARYIGVATEALAVHTGPRLGGFLNATLGNAAELIITIAAIREGLLELVKASITGSILGNLLMVMGLSMVLGGLRNGIQRFDPRAAANNAVLLALSTIALIIPSLLSKSIGPETSIQVEVLSLGVAGVMIVLYGLGVLFSFSTPASTHSGPAPTQTPEEQAVLAEHAHQAWSVRQSLIVLAVVTAGVAFLSELLVGSVEPVVHSLGVSEFFLGVILIPIVGNIAEHLVAVTVAMANKMDLSVEISLASSLQVALFVAPVLVFISLILGNPLTLIFNSFELLALIAGVMIAALVSMDGESNWLEGAELLAVYVILAFAFYMLPV